MSGLIKNSKKSVEKLIHCIEDLVTKSGKDADSSHHIIEATTHAIEALEALLAQIDKKLASYAWFYRILEQMHVHRDRAVFLKETSGISSSGSFQISIPTNINSVFILLFFFLGGGGWVVNVGMV